MKILNLDNVNSAEEFDRLTPGGYVCGITAVEDVPERGYLRIEFDIGEGKLKNYYRTLYNSKGFWGGHTIKSYKEKALPFFKGFITSVEESNAGYKWDNDENKLVRKLVGMVLAEEEYRAKDGSIKTRLYVSNIMSADKIRKGDFKVPSLKKLPNTNVSTPADFEEVITDVGVPF
jgi:hypothetical protein